MKKNNLGKLIGRAVMEVLLFSTLTGCAYVATEHVMPQIESPASSVSSAMAETIPLDSSPAPTPAEERRVMHSILAEGIRKSL